MTVRVPLVVSAALVSVRDEASLLPVATVMVGVSLVPVMVMVTVWSVVTGVAPELKVF